MKHFNNNDAYHLCAQEVLHKLRAREKARKRGIHPGFETQGRCHQKSRTGVSVAPRKGLMSSKNVNNKSVKIVGSQS